MNLQMLRTTLMLAPVLCFVCVTSQAQHPHVPATSSSTVYSICEGTCRDEHGNDYNCTFCGKNDDGNYYLADLDAYYKCLNSEGHPGYSCDCSEPDGGVTLQVCLAAGCEPSFSPMQARLSTPGGGVLSGCQWEVKVTNRCCCGTQSGRATGATFREAYRQALSIAQERCRQLGGGSTCVVWYEVLQRPTCPCPTQTCPKQTCATNKGKPRCRLFSRFRR